MAPRQAQRVPIPQVCEVEVAQELVRILAARLRGSDREFTRKRVGEKLPSGVLHDERARGPALPTIGSPPVQGDRPGSGSGQPTQNAHEGRFPNAVHSRDAGDLSCREVRVQPVEHGGVPVGEAQIPAGQAHSPFMGGLLVGVPRGHPCLGRARIHEGTQSERLPLRVIHRVELLTTPRARDLSALHEENLVGEPPQEVEAVLDDNDRHPLLFEDRECAPHVGDGIGVQV